MGLTSSDVNALSGEYFKATMSVCLPCMSRKESPAKLIPLEHRGGVLAGVLVIRPWLCWPFMLSKLRVAAWPAYPHHRNSSVCEQQLDKSLSAEI